ncbi:MAG: protein translocase subunit SecF [bacterium]
MMELIKNPKLNFIGARKVTYIFSILLVLNGLYAMYLIGAGKAKMGLDFTGGLSMQVQFSKDINTEQIRTIISKNGFDQAVIQKMGTDADKIYLLRLGNRELKGKVNPSAEIISILSKATGDTAINELETNEVGSLVSSQIKQKALMAVIWALVGILVYIWIRFKFKFAVAATIATLHDVLAVLGIMVLLGKEIDLLVITALLTVAGYSLTDTVVVFDRIRENMRQILKKTFTEVVNFSINEVLSRTIVTSFTTLLVAVSLLVFGGNVLHTFSLAVTIGIIIGTYSSDFLAAPIITDWENFEAKNKNKN